MGGAADLPGMRRGGQVRPDIVWFGEMPYEMDRIDRALMEADLFVSIGTSGNVYPAAGFVQTARYVRRADAGDEPGAEPRLLSVRRKPDGEGRGTGAGMGGGGAE